MGIFARIFARRGTFTPAVRDRLAADGVLLMEEGVGGHVVFRNYRAPRRVYPYRRIGAVFAMAATRKGLVVMTSGRPVIDVAWSAPQLQALEPSVNDKGRLTIGFDAAAFGPDRQGRIEVRASSAHPGDWVAVIERYR